jgi:hypothetical protein
VESESKCGLTDQPTGLPNVDPLQRAKEARKIAEKATPGPWYAWHELNGDYTLVHGKNNERIFTRDDAEFAAKARTDIPLLADAVEKLIAERDRLLRWQRTACEIDSNLDWDIQRKIALEDHNG